MSVTKVAGNEGPKPLLSCSVPQLEAIIFTFVDDIFGQEVDADGWLGKAELHVPLRRTCH